MATEVHAPYSPLGEPPRASTRVPYAFFVHICAFPTLTCNVGEFDKIWFICRYFETFEGQDCLWERSGVAYFTKINTKFVDVAPNNSQITSITSSPRVFFAYMCISNTYMQFGKIWVFDVFSWFFEIFEGQDRLWERYGVVFFMKILPNYVVEVLNHPETSSIAYSPHVFFAYMCNSITWMQSGKIQKISRFSWFF